MKTKLIPRNHAKYLLFASGLEKQFGSTKALVNGVFHLKSGEIHALTGENGAGKSTFIKILSGYYAPDGGGLYYRGKEQIFRSPATALKQGICVVHQELSLFDDLSITDNLFPGNIARSAFGLNWKQAKKEAQKAMDIVGLTDISPDIPVGILSIAKKQLVEIARAVYQNTDVLILDEPTSSLGVEDIEKLFQTLGKLKKRGTGIIFISHKFDEVLKISDRITVFKDGNYSGTILNLSHSDNQDIRNKLVYLMVGREISHKYRKHKKDGNLVLDVQNLNSERFHNISFSVRAGEILGFAGLIGSGRSSLCQAIFGVSAYNTGCILYKGRVLPRCSIQKSIQAGISMVPEDRRKKSLFCGLSVSYNICVLLYKKFICKGYLHSNNIDHFIQKNKKKFKIKMNNSYDIVDSLSGGNQQKSILARWLSHNPDLIILDEPTHGIDIGAKAEIYKLIHSLADQYKAIILISSELEEILAMCDRVIVMKNGGITAILNRSELSEERILKYAL